MAVGGRRSATRNVKCILSKCTQMRLVNGNVLFPLLLRLHIFHYLLFCLACLGTFIGMGYCVSRSAACFHTQTHLKRTNAALNVCTLLTYFETVNFLTCNNFIFKRKSAIKLKNVQQRPFIRHAANVNTDNTQSRHIHLTSPSIRFVFFIRVASLREYAQFHFGFIYSYSMNH